MIINKENILKYSRRYDERYKRSEELVEIEIKNWLESNKYLDRKRFVKICLWKSSRAKRHYEANRESLVKEMTKFSFTTKNEEARIKTLLALKGVSYPVASAILHFAFPDKYTIMDFRVIWSLGWEQPSSYDFEFWQKYNEEIKRLSKKFNFPIRTIDKALWQNSKENQKR